MRAQCFMEPLKKVQVEGHLMFAEPHELFGNLDELCYVRCSVYSKRFWQPSKNLEYLNIKISDICSLTPYYFTTDVLR